MLEPFDPLQHPAIARGLGLLKIFGEQIEIERDRRERVSNLMGKPAGELGDFRVLGTKPARNLRLFLGRRESTVASPPGAGRARPPIRAGWRIACRRFRGSAGFRPGWKCGESEAQLPGMSFATRALRPMPEV